MANMPKATKRPLIQSDSEDSDFDKFDQDVHSLMSASKRPKPSLPAAQSSGSGSSSDPDSDAEWTMDRESSSTKKAVTSSSKNGRGGCKVMVQRKVGHKKMTQLPSSSESSEEDEDEKDEDEMKSSGSGATTSDSDSSSQDSLKFDDGLNEDLLRDDEDQNKLSLMNETKREAEMYNRFEKREALKARFEIEQKLHRQKKNNKKKVRKEKMMRSLRDSRSKKKDRSKTQAMDEYRAKRSADKMRKAEAEKHSDEKKPLRASDIFSSESESEVSSSGESESHQGDSDEDASGNSALHDSSAKFVCTVSELAKIRLSRYRLEKWAHMPFFSEAVVGCFVRIGIGAHKGRMVYRICEVLAVQETTKVYTLGSTTTNKGLKLRHGIQERIFRMEYVSNSPFVESEFNKWLIEMNKRGLKPPTTDFIQRKTKRLEAFKNVSLKEEDIEKIVVEKQKFRKNPRNYAMTKSRMMREKEIAEQEGEMEMAKVLSDKLDALEERADLLDKQRTKGLSAITYINERNRHWNVTRAETALKEELAATDGKEDDPFTRRKCQPTLVTLAVRDSVMSELLQELPQEKEATAAVGSSDEILKILDVTPSLTQLSAPPVPPEQVDDLFTAHNFDIHIDLPSGEDDSTSKSLPRSSTATKQAGPKRSLNLADYKKRRGLI